MADPLPPQRCKVWAVWLVQVKAIRRRYGRLQNAQTCGGGRQMKEAQRDARANNYVILNRTHL
jgi:hypothetical protein